MSYNFKGIHTILPAKDLVNVILSKTQRKTPTVIHPGYDIGRIRAFYMRKVKFTQDTIHEKLDTILKDFPKLEDIHPFFADLLNVLYDRDHYKLALGHVNACKNVIDNVSKDYVRLLKYGDSLYRCKMLKRAALGRMCTSLKKLTSSLNYLEEVRKHLARLPSINPFERTLLVTGFPNVGKSSFVNNITNANLDVQPYPFTTQNLFVGHTDYNFVRFQVIDTPGVLDKPLQQRSTIEMQAITALAHLKACIMFFIDISETCSFSIEKQIALFQDLKPLFKNKPVLVVYTKVDLKKFEDLEPESQQLLNDLLSQENVHGSSLSNISGEGTSDVKNAACDLLLKSRLEAKPEALSGGSNALKAEEEFLQGIYVAKPKMTREDRPPQIPEHIKEKLNRQTLRELQEQYGGAGVFNFPFQEHFILENPDWKYDLVPEIMDGKNIVDFVDADILQRLEELEREEEMIGNQEIDIEMDDDEREMWRARKEIISKRTMLKEAHKMRANNDVIHHKPNLTEMKQTLGEQGIDTQFLDQRAQRLQDKNKRRPLSVSRLAKEVARDNDEEREGQMEDEKDGERRRSQKRFNNKMEIIERSRSRGQPKKELTPLEQAMERSFKKIQRGRRNEAKAGDGDTKILDMMPKHLYTGKSGIGKRDYR